MSKTKFVGSEDKVASLLRNGYVLTKPLSETSQVCEITKPGKLGVYFETSRAVWDYFANFTNSPKSADLVFFELVVLKEPGHIAHSAIVSKDNAKAFHYVVDPGQADFDAQPALSKKTVMKLKPGALLEIKWLDSENSIGMLLAKPENQKGDVDLDLFFFERGERSTHAVHTQVVGVLGHIQLTDVGGVAVV